MTIDEGINRIAQLEYSVSDMQRYRRYLIDRAEKVSSVLTDMPGSAIRDPHRREMTLVEIADIEVEIGNAVNEIRRIRESIIRTAHQQENSSLRDVIIERFINENTVPQTALKLNYCKRQIQRLSKIALSKKMSPP